MSGGSIGWLLRRSTSTKATSMATPPISETSTTGGSPKPRTAGADQTEGDAAEAERGE